MHYIPKNEKLELDDTTIDYISFGDGPKTLIMIPGLGDGLKNVKGLALPLSHMYKEFASDYKVYMFSRRNDLKEDFKTTDMAEDIVVAMDFLNIEKADVIGVSQGGMIAQCLAISHPKRVRKLVLTVTSSRPTELMKENVDFWLDCVQKNDYKSLIIDTAEKSYTETYLQKCRKFYSILSHVGKPKDFTRFIIQAHACLTHDTYSELNKIKNPTIIIGASDDKILGVDASYELHNRISGSELHIFEGYGHGVYEENEDYNDVVLKFLSE